MSDFEQWWNDSGLAEFVRHCAAFGAPVTVESTDAAKLAAWGAWIASSVFVAKQLGIAA
jgi:hypothetical protein